MIWWIIVILISLEIGYRIGYNKKRGEEHNERQKRHYYTDN